MDPVDNLVRRTYPYVSMYNVINKATMMPENPSRADWNNPFCFRPALVRYRRNVRWPWLFVEIWPDFRFAEELDYQSGWTSTTGHF